MDLQELKITTVARAVQDEDTEEVFNYKSKDYKKLLDWDDFEMILREFLFLPAKILGN